MKMKSADTRIVSPPALPYTERARFSCHFNREGAHLCKLKFSVNQAEED